MFDIIVSGGQSEFYVPWIIAGRKGKEQGRQINWQQAIMNSAFYVTKCNTKNRTQGKSVVQCPFYFRFILLSPAVEWELCSG